SSLSPPTTSANPSIHCPSIPDVGSSLRRFVMPFGAYGSGCFGRRNDGGVGRSAVVRRRLSGLSLFPQWRRKACLTWIGRYRTSALNTARRQAATAPEGDPSGGVAQLVRAP